MRLVLDPRHSDLHRSICSAEGLEESRVVQPVDMSDEYRDHHYVPQWYQKRFMPQGEHEWFYLDLKPETLTDPRGVPHVRRAVKRQGAKKSFFERDLYTTKLHGVETRDIEKYFFGDIDSKGLPAVEYFDQFTHPPAAGGSAFRDFLLYMSTQKLRTPKGLLSLSRKIGSDSKDTILQQMLALRQLHCAIWTECVWLIADASQSSTKFIVSDHPVTVYNRACGPSSQWCKNSNDPDIWLQGTHTIFPLSINKVLMLTNLSWVRNPYQSGIRPRPNPNLFRTAIFNFLQIQILRHLDETEVRQINFLIKSRAHRYIAAAREDWLYPEQYVSKSEWNTFGHGYLLMPDPRPIHTGGEILMGFKNGSSSAFDEYGRRPWDADYNKESKSLSETDTLAWFQGEFAQLFGPTRRGRCMSVADLDRERDSDEFHKYHLSLQKKFYKQRRRSAS